MLCSYGHNILPAFRGFHPNGACIQALLIYYLLPRGEGLMYSLPVKLSPFRCINGYGQTSLALWERWLRRRRRGLQLSAYPLSVAPRQLPLRGSLNILPAFIRSSLLSLLHPENRLIFVCVDNYAVAVVDIAHKHFFAHCVFNEVLDGSL